jgi:hypothetical protein
MKSAVKAAGADDKYVDVAWWRRGVVTGDTRGTTLRTGTRGRMGRRGRKGKWKKVCLLKDMIKDRRTM